MEYDHTSLKRHLFINKFLYISFLIWGSWNSFPIVHSILVHFGSKRSLDGWFFMVVILLNRSCLCLHLRSISWSWLGWYIVYIIPSIFGQLLHSTPGTGCGLGSVLLLYISIFHCHTLITFQICDMLISFVHFQENFEHRSSLLWWQDLVMTTAAGQWFAMTTLHLWVLHWRRQEICRRRWNIGT